MRRGPESGTDVTPWSVLVGVGHAARARPVVGELPRVPASVLGVRLVVAMELRGCEVQPLGLSARISDVSVAGAWQVSIRVRASWAHQA